MTPTNTVLLTPRKNWAKRFAALRPTAVSSKAKLHMWLSHARRDTLWISDDRRLTAELLKSVSPSAKRIGRAVLLFRPTLQAIVPLRECFDPLAFGAQSEFLPQEELAEALSADNRHELFIGGTVDKESETVTLWRGNLEALVVPFSACPASGAGVAPDFDDFAVTDYGQTVRFGKYEAAADAILYEYDADYRRQVAKARLKSERTLGASIRRLRLQRGLRQDHFGQLTKTLARIERGEVKKPRPKTLAAIAKVLRVTPQELATY